VAAEGQAVSSQPLDRGAAVRQAGCGGFVAGFVAGLIVMAGFVLIAQHLQLGWR
jgi:hypothetical protein